MQLDEVNFFKPEINKCPYDAYQVLRDEAPVWLDPLTGFYVVTRYDDLRAIIFDTENFANGIRMRARIQTPEMMREFVQQTLKLRFKAVRSSRWRIHWEP